MGSALHHSQACESVRVFLLRCCRAIMLPMCVYNMRKTHKKEWDDLGLIGQGSITAISGLQWYWLFKIGKKFLFNV